MPPSGTDVKTQDITATAEDVNAADRTMTLRRSDGSAAMLKFPPEVPGFEAIAKGDRITVRYTEALVVGVRKAGE